MRRQLSIVITLLLGTALGTPTLLAQNSQRIGTWKLNLQKSTYDPGPAPKSETRVYEPFDGGIKNTIHRTEADGTQTTIEWAARYDGKDYPYKGSNAYDAIAVTRVDDYTNKAVLKKAGKVMTNNISVIAKDGKTLTITATGVNAAGKAVRNVTVFDKQ